MTLESNRATERPTFVTHLECSLTGERYEADRLHGLSAAGRPILVRYDLAGIAKALSRETLKGREPDFWRYREFLPVRRRRNIVSLGEIMTPLISLDRSARELGAGEILVKDEGRLPTGGGTGLIGMWKAFEELEALGWIGTKRPR
jgi:threonine synthase